MSNDIKVTKREVNNFLLINFGLIAFIAIFIFIANTRPNGSVFISNFAGLFMYIPAFSGIVVLRRISKYEFNLKVDKFFKVFEVITILRIAVSIAEVFLIGNIIISAVIDTIVSLYLVILVFMNKSEFEILNLNLGKNFKKVLLVISLFALIVVVSDIPSFLSIKGEGIDIGNNIFLAFIALVSNIFFGFSLFFGEEFGWRYFLQPRLQKLYGKRYGVIILGLIWGIWHLPLCMTLYSPDTPIYCIINHLSFCTFLGIFLGYIYMETKNLWAPILVHLVNNCISIIVGGGYEVTFTLDMLLWSVISSAIFFLPFLLTKVYKSDKVDEIV